MPSTDRCGHPEVMSEKRMERYYEELEWRFNNRKNRYTFRDAPKRIVPTDNITYREPAT